MTAPGPHGSDVVPVWAMVDRTASSPASALSTARSRFLSYPLAVLLWTESPTTVTEIDASTMVTRSAVTRATPSSSCVRRRRVVHHFLSRSALFIAGLRSLIPVGCHCTRCSGSRTPCCGR